MISPSSPTTGLAKTEPPDALRDLPDLLPGMGAGIASAGRPVDGWCERAACAIALFTLCSNRRIRIKRNSPEGMAERSVNN
jgi:hypothetical protein